MIFFRSIIEIHPVVHAEFSSDQKQSSCWWRRAHQFVYGLCLRCGSDVISSVQTTWTLLASHFNMKQINISTFGGMFLLPGPTAQTDSRTREPQAAALQERSQKHTHPKAAAVLQKTTGAKWVTVNHEAQTSHKNTMNYFCYSPESSPDRLMCPLI